MKIVVTSILVDDQAKALAFYHYVLGFEPRHDIPMGRHLLADADLPSRSQRRRAVAGARRAPGVQGVQGRAQAGWHPRHLVWRARYTGRIHPPLRGGRAFTQPPTDIGPVTVAVFDDTCGNLIQIAQKHRQPHAHQ